MSKFSSAGSLPLQAVDALMMGKRSRGAAIGLLFYDHMISLELEIDLVWRQRKNRLGFCLYLFNRIFSFAYLIFDAIPLTKAGTNTSQACLIYLMGDDVVTLVQTLVVQAVLQLRVYVLYNRSHRILLFLLALCAIEVAIMTTLVGITISQLRHSTISSTDSGCYYDDIMTFSALFWVPGLVFEPILFLMVAYQALPSRDGYPQAPMVTKLARDSLLYFIAIFAELMISTSVWARAPTYINMIMPWSAALPSILCSRLLLNMREMVLKSGNGNYILETLEPDKAGCCCNVLAIIFDNRDHTLEMGLENQNDRAEGLEPSPVSASEGGYT